MISRLYFTGIAIWFMALGCRPVENVHELGQEQPWFIDSTLTEAKVLDKTLGFVIGSAIGDAMGAPVEMWHRRDIIKKYGYINTLIPVIREASAEGPWITNLPAGGTTDDTRWKLLLIRYLQNHPALEKDLDERAFASHILAEFDQHWSAFQAMDTTPAGAYLAQEMKVHWLQEWAAVSKGYLSGDVYQYSLTVNKFYGGDLACGGLLYGPGIGVFYAGLPLLAYDNAYRLGLYDLGYARDLTALSAAFTAALCRTGVNPDSALAEVYRYDPHHLGEARLLGRMATGIYLDARKLADQALEHNPSAAELSSLDIPAGWPDTRLQYARQTKAYDLMDDRLQQIPFHAGEIWMIALTAMMFNHYDFQHTLQFITNFGRDNDTAGAMAGAILGAYHGYKNLQGPYLELVETTNTRELNQPLIKSGKLLAERIWDRAYKL